MKTYSDYNIHISDGISGEQRTICPTCSGTRRKSGDKCLAVNTEKGTWICHHCGYTGGLGSNKYDIPEYKYPKKEYSRIIDYFQKRGISKKTVEYFKIGFDGRNIMFPYYRNGIVINIKHRDAKKNMFQSKNAEKSFYNLQNIDPAKPVIITEGEIDTMVMHDVGFTNVISVPDGAPAVNAKNFNSKFSFLNTAPELKDTPKFIIAVDGDDPGEILAEELSRRLGKEKCWKVNYPYGTKDANDVLKKLGKDATVKLIEKAKPYPVNGLFNPSDYEQSVINMYYKGPEQGIKTGWAILDEFYTVGKGQLNIITGIPSSGKSNWLDALIVKLIGKDDWRVALFSPENWPPEKHLQTLTEKISNLPFFDSYNKKPRMDVETVKDVLEYLEDRIFIIKPDEEKQGITVDSILELAKVALFRHGIHGLVIDPWNEIDHNYNNLSEVQYISKELSKIRRWGRDNGVTIWIVAHPKNLIKDAAGVYKPPTMYEISGGSQWRNKADVGICIHRDNYQTDEVRVIIQKVRFRDIGKPGEAKLRYKYATATYETI